MSELSKTLQEDQPDLRTRLKASIQRALQARVELKSRMEGQLPIDFQGHKGRVLYIPHHACYDKEHKDCEIGLVSSTNAHWVFVRYWNPATKTYSPQGKATDATQLLKLK